MSLTEVQLEYNRAYQRSAAGKASRARTRIRTLLKKGNLGRPTNTVYYSAVLLVLREVCNKAKVWRQREINLKRQAAREWVAKSLRIAVPTVGHPEKHGHDPAYSCVSGEPETADIRYHGDLWWRGEW